MSGPDKTNSMMGGMGDIDVERLTQAISEHQNTVIKLLFVIVTIVMVVLMFSDCQHKKWVMHQKISNEQAKLQTIGQRDSSVSDLNHFKSSLPQKLNEFEFIALISDKAKPFRVSITSLTPADLKDSGLYSTTTVNLQAVSDSFKDMMLYLRALEKSEYPVRIQSWSGHEQLDGTMTFSISVSLISIHSS